MKLTVTLEDELAEFVQTKVRSGRYRSSAEVVEEALRLMDASVAEDLPRLREAWQAGIKSADFTPLDIAAVEAEGQIRLDKHSAG
jgi:putative addiction module antidote protein, CC2985 family